MKKTVALSEIASKTTAKLKQNTNTNAQTHYPKSPPLSLHQQLGLSTILDISISSIKQKPVASSLGNSKTLQKTKINKLTKHMNSLKQQAQAMRKKRQKLEQNTIILKSQAFMQDPQYIQKEQLLIIKQNRFLEEISKEITVKKLTDFCFKIKACWVRLLARQVNIYTLFQRHQTKKQKQSLALVFNHWKLEIKRNGEKEQMLSLIREKIKARRSSRNRANQILSEMDKQDAK